MPATPSTSRLSPAASPRKFLIADGTSAVAVPLPAFLQALPRRARMFADAGVGPPVLSSVTCQQLDERYVLARTDWTAPRTTSGDPVHLSSSFLLDHGEDGFRIVVYLTRQGLPAPDTVGGYSTTEKHTVRPNTLEVPTVTMHDGLAERVYVLEAKDEIRRLMAAYVHARDFANTSIDNYFTDDAVWEGVDEQVRRRWPHLADILGPQVGRDAIVKRFAGPLPPVLHLLANESITVNGDNAVGYWTYLQPSVLGGRAHWVAGQYHIHFRREDGRWRIRHLQVQGIFEAPYDQGWAQVEFFQR